MVYVHFCCLWNCIIQASKLLICVVMIVGKLITFYVIFFQNFVAFTKHVFMESVK